MTFLGWPTEHHRHSSRTEARRKAIVLRLIDKFAETFSEIDYDLLWDAPTINAQAWRIGDRRGVTVYGGLARHSAIGVPGIALMLAHETGHHLGGPPLDPDWRWATWQGQADYWAAAEGMPKVFGAKAQRLTLKGCNEMARLHLDFFRNSEDAPEISVEERAAIFRAGAMGQPPPACLQMAFERLLQERISFRSATPEN